MGGFDHLFDNQTPTTLDDIKLLVGERLKTIRKSNDLQMVDIEKEFDITRQTINNLEKGEGNLNSFFIYLRALGVMDDFLDSFFKDYQSRAERLKLFDKFI